MRMNDSLPVKPAKSFQARSVASCVTKFQLVPFAHAEKVRCNNSIHQITLIIHLLILCVSTEYITQLEGELATKANECNDLRAQKQALAQENARSRAFIEKVLRHPAFHPFLEDLSSEAAAMQVPAQLTASPVADDVSSRTICI